MNFLFSWLTDRGEQAEAVMRQLHERYSKVFSVQRAFDIEVVSVWKIRKGD